MWFTRSKFSFCMFVIFLVLCFSFRYMCVAVFIAFHFVFNNWYLESTFNQFTEKREKKIIYQLNNLQFNLLWVRFTLISNILNHWWKKKFIFILSKTLIWSSTSLCTYPFLFVHLAYIFGQKEFKKFENLKFIFFFIFKIQSYGWNQ